MIRAWYLRAIYVTFVMFERHNLAPAIVSTCDHDCYFFTYGGLIPQTRLAARPDDSTAFINELVEQLPVLEGSGSVAVQPQYTADMCNALPGMLDSARLTTHLANPNKAKLKPYLWTCARSLPAAAAAAGNTTLLASLISTPTEALEHGSPWFPNALNAAVASNKPDTVPWMLQNLRSLRTLALRRVEDDISAALRVAVRKNNSSISHIILDFCFAQRRVCPCERGMLDTVQESMQLGHVELLSRILEYRTLHEPGYIQHATQNGLPISTAELEYLFLRGSARELKDMPQNGTLSPNVLDRHLPLSYAVRFSRLHLAIVLLHHGANIHA
jgi:hypothetical protein